MGKSWHRYSCRLVYHYHFHDWIRLLCSYVYVPLHHRKPGSNTKVAEEIKDASETLPKAMMSAVGVNGILGFIMIVTLCFTLGDVNNILQSPTGFPFIQIFYNTTRSYAAANTMAAILVITLTASTITEVATASRQLWSFARDQGLPFSSFFAYVSTIIP